MSGADRAWMDRAACLGMPVNKFFPEPGRSDQAAEAVAVCLGCPVIAECLADALARREVREGIRGGTTPAERLELYRAQARAA